ncbi:conserved hypothetical protein [Shewanella sp. ANA-3]|uniref:hypothetical protein n=1 Tax=Shewanella sp. (strain ANA-3) TaxID=94122 RepID=UPI00005DED5E|nr:hypothetical protein [Shewanella sp. ANA-3]ABK46755.1 conserved hypothetical protein [Shewanella sp. ANA-3]
MVTLLIAIIVLQFAGANLGAHQLHAGNGAEEAENHPHLQFSAPVTTLAQCVDCVCANEQTPGFSAEQFGEAAFKAGVSTASASGHSHLVQTTEIQNFDLCLDCQCHGGHVALLSHSDSQTSIAFETAYVPTDLAYFPPDQLPKYRPPIA